MSQPGEGSDKPSGDLGDLPEEVRKALGGLPQSFQDALGQAPPEVRKALENFQGGTEADIGGTSFDDALAGVPVDAKDMLARLTAPAGKLEVTFSRSAYGPGDTVEGRVVARERVKARELQLGLAYVEQSPNYSEHTVHDDAGALHKGSLDPGTEVPFSLQLPRGAPPNWDPAGARRLDLAAYGHLYWAVVTTATRRGVVAHDIERHPVPLIAEDGPWLGPDPGDVPGEVQGKAKSWDVEIEIDRWAPRRGEEVTVGLTIGQPSADRDGLRVGLVGEIHYDVETTSTSTDGDGMSHTTTSRSTRIATAHEEWATVDPSAPHQDLRLEIPENAPFSHGGERAKKVGGKFTFNRSKLRHDSAFSVVWKVVALEERQLRRDPRREARIQVLP